MANARWQRRHEGSNWGKFGPDDQLGRLNLLTEEKVRQGVAEAEVVGVFQCAAQLDNRDHALGINMFHLEVDAETRAPLC